ncbi:MAG: TorF family putative porin [Thermoanaerobaculia bacterium]|nr:TorF family putative porin [Thermoanaerobaculia bacterium]
MREDEEGRGGRVSLRVAAGAIAGQPPSGPNRRPDNRGDESLQASTGSGHERLSALPRLLAVGILWVGLLLPGTTAPALTLENLSASVTLATDYVLRGVSQTGGDPAIQGGFHFEHPSGVFAGLWASNAELPFGSGRLEGRNLELDVYLGFGFDLSPRWALVTTLVHYAYPGSEAVFDYEYEELSLSLQNGDRWAAGVTFTDDAFGFGDAALTWELTTRLPLPRGLDLTAGVGYYDLEQVFDTGYWFWNLGLTRSWGRFTLDLGWFGTGDEADTIWGELADDRLVLSLTAGIR